ncbi:capsule biosynthesis GfcC family protein [Shewanella mangrovisoli]|uniref:capsule biosynthesis GfcC family protein n=1 Tax=Shewanella mangrovisoli TaxID=2864211 RepID=UPI0035BACA78
MRPYLTSLTLLISVFLSNQVQSETQLLITSSAEQNTLIEITYPKTIRIQQAVHDGLTQLPIHNKSSSNDVVPIYWLGAALLDIKNTASLETKRQQILNQLIQMGEATDDSHYIARLAKLAQFIRKIKLGQRVIQPLDIDLIRINQSFNAALDGRFLLVLPPRPTTVTLLGAVEQMGSYEWQSNIDSKEYLKQAGLLNNAETSTVWIIQPDGKAIKQPIAYWNNQEQDIAPGASIYVEFSGLFDDYSTLNNNIIELLKNRAL